MEVIRENIQICNALTNTINTDRRRSMEIEDFLSVPIGPKIDMLCSRRLKEKQFIFCS